MLALDTTFAWPVASSGYRWQEDVVEDELNHPHLLLPEEQGGEQFRFRLSERTAVLKARLPARHDHPHGPTDECPDCTQAFRWYHPFRDYPDLYEQFAALNVKRKDFLEFANRYGHLTPRIQAEEWFHQSERQPEGPARLRRDSYQRRLRCFSNADTESRQDRATDEVWTLWSEETFVLWRKSVLAVREVLHRWKPISRSSARDRYARQSIHDTINQNLRGRVDVVFIGAADTTLRPISLLGAVWLQVADFVHGRPSLKACRECKRLFRPDLPQRDPDGVGSGGSESSADLVRAARAGRRNKTYCSKACSDRAVYKRRLKDKAKSRKRKSAKGSKGDGRS